MDTGMAATADSNKVAVLGDARPPMMDRQRPLPAPRTTTRLAEVAIARPHPFAMSAEEPSIEPLTRVAAAAEAARRDQPIPTDPTPQVPLPRASRGRFSSRYLLNARHTRLGMNEGLVSQQSAKLIPRPDLPTTGRAAILQQAVAKLKRT
jgi:hypothetical protein